MNWIFVDTSAWCAYFDKSDSKHHAAIEFIEETTLPLITSNYIIDETLTLTMNHIGHKCATDIGKKFFAGQIAQFVRITAHDEITAFKLFDKYTDKDFSFTDCTSFVVMERLKIKKAFTFDKHFKQYGKIIVVP